MTPARQRLLDAAKEFTAGCDLIELALASSMVILTENWSSVLSYKETDPSIVLSDLDDLVFRLQSVRKRLEEVAPNAVERMAEEP